MPNAPNDIAPSPLRGRDYVFILALLLAALIPGTIGVSLFDRDEGWYAQITKEMLASRDWAFPHYLGERNYFKPPLLYWCSAASVAVLGWSEFALRLPCVLASAAAWLVAAVHTARWWGRAAGYWCAGLAATSLGPSIAGKLLLADGYLLLFITLAMCCWLHAIEHGGRAGRLFWIAVGMAFLAKGPAALVVLVPVAVMLLWTESPRGTALLERIRRIWPGRGWYLAIAIGLPWYAFVALKDWDGFRNEFLGVHVAGRLGGVVEGHTGPPGFYLLTSAGALWPWAVLVPSVVHLAWRQRRTDPHSQRLLLWIVAPWVCFELITTKLPHYVLPLYPPVIMLLSRFVTLTPQRAPGSGRILHALWLTGVLLGPVVCIAGVVLLRNTVPTMPLLSMAGVLGLAGVFVLLTGSRRDAANRAIVAISIAICTQIAGWKLLPALEGQRLSRNVADAANFITRENDMVFTEGFDEPSMFFYLDRPGRRLRPGGGIQRPAPGDEFVLVALESRLAGLSAVLTLDETRGHVIQGFNYVRGRHTRVWVGRAGRPK